MSELERLLRGGTLEEEIVSRSQNWRQIRPQGGGVRFFSKIEIYILDYEMVMQLNMCVFQAFQLHFGALSKSGLGQERATGYCDYALSGNNSTQMEPRF